MIVDIKIYDEYFGEMIKVNIDKITAEGLDQMVGDGKAILKEVTPGQWSIKVDGENIGSVNTDHLKGEQVISVGGRELARFTPR